MRRGPSGSKRLAVFQLLKELRPFEVIFPKNFKHGSTDKFDVLYVLDGEWNTSLAARAYEFLEYAKFVPTNIIIVNVPNSYKKGMNMRDRDFVFGLLGGHRFSLHLIYGQI